MFRHLAAATLSLAVAVPALANEAAIKARQGNFQMYALNIGVLAQMAQGKAIERIKVSAAKNGDFKYAVACATDPVQVPLPSLFNGGSPWNSVKRNAK